ncbi:MAG: TIM barrel protein [Clostridia bacterium]
MIYSGLVTATFRDLDAEQIVKLCKEAGIESIEWSSDVHVKKGDIEHATYVKNLCDEHNIAVASYATYYTLGQNEDVEKEFDLYAQVAKVLGTKFLRVWAGKVDTKIISKEKRDALIDEANVIATLAKEQGLILSYEYHHETLTETLESTEYLLNNTHNTMTHWQRPYGSTFELNIMQIKTLKDDIKNFHVNNAHSRGNYQLLEEIIDEWVSYLKLVKDEERDIYACLEFAKDKSIISFLKDAKALKEILVKVYE